MKKHKLLIVEDNIITAKHISNTLQKFGYEVTGMTNSIESTEKSIISNRPDLVILDINLGRDIDGIHIAEILNRDFSLPYLFLTSYNDEKTINRIIKVQPLGYIVKPFNPVDLNTVIELALYKVRTAISKTDTPPPSNNLPANPTDLNEFLFVKNGRNIDRVPITQIEFISADGRYTYIYYDNHKKISNASLKTLKEKLKGRPFVQTHKSYIVNLSKVETIALSYLHIGEHEVPVSKNFRSGLLDVLDVI
ncbi:MAG: response regulator [Cyclobacteriaceae bacterium]|nr:response regulator [Cyclobacteriaceae bacterium]